MSRPDHDHSPQAVQDCHEPLAWMVRHRDKFPRLRRALFRQVEFSMAG